MIISEKELHFKVIEPLIGIPVNFSYKNPKSLGSTSYFLKKFSSNAETQKLRINSKCNFQLYSKGVLLKAFYSTEVKAIPLPFKDITKIELIRGEEFVNPIFPSIMWFLLKLGVSILIARYFSLRLNQYSIEDMEMKITTSEYSILFTADGHLFESQDRLFRKLPVNVISQF